MVQNIKRVSGNRMMKGHVKSRHQINRSLRKMRHARVQSFGNAKGSLYGYMGSCVKRTHWARCVTNRKRAGAGGCEEGSTRIELFADVATSVILSSACQQSFSRESDHAASSTSGEKRLTRVETRAGRRVCTVRKTCLLTQQTPNHQSQFSHNAATPLAHKSLTLSVSTSRPHRSPPSVLFILLHRVLPGPLFREFVVPRRVGFKNLRDFRHQRVIWVRVGEERAD